MAKRQFQLTSDELAAIKEAERQTRDVHERRRLQAVRLYGTGEAQANIETVVGCNERSVRKWAGQYRASGVAGLRSHWRGGNANKLSAAQREELKTRLHQQAPHEVLALDAQTSRGQFWSAASLREAVRLWYGVSWADDDSYRQLLRRCGFSPQRPQGPYRSRATAETVSAFEATVKKQS
jgi:transposase